MSDVVISEFMGADAVRSLADEFDVRYDPTLVDDRTSLLQAISGARALIVRNRTQVDAELLAAAPDLEVVGRLGVGLDNIDVAECEERRVAVRPATGANADAVAEYVVAAVLVLVRGVFSATPRVAAGDWPREAFKGREVAGRRVGLVGFGDIARRVADRLAALGMEVAAHDPYLPSGDPAWGSVERCALDELLASCDAFSVHVPLVDETRHLIDADVIATMPTGAVVVNTSRGGVVDEGAVVDALRRGHLGGAALDVFETEPLVGAAAERLADVPNLILTPHVAGITEESDVRVGAMTADQVRFVLRAQS